MTENSDPTKEQEKLLRAIKMATQFTAIKIHELGETIRLFYSIQVLLFLALIATLYLRPPS